MSGFRNKKRKFIEFYVLKVNHGWTGLLVEGNPLFYEAGLRKHRKVKF